MAHCTCSLAHGRACPRPSSPSSLTAASASASASGSVPVPVPVAAHGLDPASAHTPAHAHAPELATASDQLLRQSDLRNLCELATEPLAAVHAFLSLLCDCSIANTEPRSGMRMDSLVILLRDLAEQLAEAERRIDRMAATARDAFPAADPCSLIEDQGCAVRVVRSGLCVLDDAIGACCLHELDIAGQAFTGTLHSMAERLQAAKTALTTIAFPPCRSMPREEKLPTKAGANQFALGC